MALRLPAPDLDPADQFQSYARAASRLLAGGALVAALVGLGYAGLQVWDTYDRVEGGPGGDQFGLRFYLALFIGHVAAYGLIAAVLFVGSLATTAFAGFQAALAADIDDVLGATAEPPGEQPEQG